MRLPRRSRSARADARLHAHVPSLPRVRCAHAKKKNVSTACWVGSLGTFLIALRVRLSLSTQTAVPLLDKASELTALSRTTTVGTLIKAAETVGSRGGYRQPITSEPVSECRCRLSATRFLNGLVLSTTRSPKTRLDHRRRQRAFSTGYRPRCHPGTRIVRNP